MNSTHIHCGMIPVRIGCYSLVYLADNNNLTASVLNNTNVQPLKIFYEYAYETGVKTCENRLKSISFYLYNILVIIIPL